MSQAGTPLDSERYISLETFKKDGGGVKTPVWATPLDGKLVVFSEGEAYKVKRIRRNPAFKAAACDVRGNVAPGATWYEGTARLVDDPAYIERALAAIKAKYGWQSAIGTFFSKLSGKFKTRAYIELSFNAG
ncbi:MAG: PPOX class F420-dependent oxidoreductase [Byssovorax sp.]